MRDALIAISSLAICLNCACSQEAEGPAVDDGITPIFRVQGSGGASPLAGERVTVRGVVTGDFQDGDEDRASDLGGFFLQEERADGDPQTSDGVFVFERSPVRDVSVGDRVIVAGEVAEFFGETQVVAETIQIVGQGSIAPAELPLPSVVATSNGDGRSIADLEPFEGMLVRIAEPLAVVDSGELGRFGSLLLALGEPPQQFTNVSAPSAAGYRAHRETVARSTLVLDDGLRAAGVTPPRYLFPDGERSVRLGDRVANAVGNLRYSRGSGRNGAETYRLMPTQQPSFAAANPRPPGPPRVGGTLRVMSLNALNYFNTLDTGAAACGPRRDLGCRGANTRRELARQRDKLANTIRSADVHIVGLMEVENDASASVADIVDALNAGEGDWVSVDTGAIGEDAIKVALLYRRSVVDEFGEHAILDGSADARFNSEKNRPALAQTFRARAGGTLTVVVNHLKSKGSPCDDLGDPNAGDGQGNCNRTRTRAANALVDWLATDPTASGDDDVLIIGDLNAYRQEDPVRAIEGAGYRLLQGAADEPAYSFVFRGERGALDHALASPSLAPQVVAAAEWHVNADEPAELDYNLEGRDADWFAADTPFRSSDHDPLLIGIDLAPE